MDAPETGEKEISMQSQWLDQFNGTAYRYGMKYRPPTPGVTCPKDGYLLRLETDWTAKHDRYPFGVVWYSRELSADEVDQYQLQFIGGMEMGTATNPDTIGVDLFGRELRKPISGTQTYLMDTRDEWSARRQGETAQEHRQRLIDAKQPSTMF